MVWVMSIQDLEAYSLSAGTVIIQISVSSGNEQDKSGKILSDPKIK